MQIKIDQSLAMQIVNTVKDVCGQDINFIDQSGIIFASTNPNRIGTFHEIGQNPLPPGILLRYLPITVSMVARTALICQSTIISHFSLLSELPENQTMSENMHIWQNASPTFLYVNRNLI